MRLLYLSLEKYMEMLKPKISIITVCLNSESTISRTVESVKNQNYENIEHLIKDGFSTDNTIGKALKVNPDLKIVRKKDIGIYDAMNQGFKESTGDIILFLNSDDWLASNSVISEVVSAYIKNSPNIISGNIKIEGINKKFTRLWRSTYKPSPTILFRQLPHPGLFVERGLLERLALPFDPNLELAGDLKQQLQLVSFLPRVFVVDQIITCMSHGGASNRGIHSLVKGYLESRQVFNELFLYGGTLFGVIKIIQKITQIFHRSTEQK